MACNKNDMEHSEFMEGHFERLVLGNPWALEAEEVLNQFGSNESVKLPEGIDRKVLAVLSELAKEVRLKLDTVDGEWVLYPAIFDADFPEPDEYIWDDEDDEEVERLPRSWEF